MEQSILWQIFVKADCIAWCLILYTCVYIEQGWIIHFLKRPHKEVGLLWRASPLMSTIAPVSYVTSWEKLIAQPDIEDLIVECSTVA